MTLASEVGSIEPFRTEVESAVRTNALLDEAHAGEREAEAARVQARSALFPTLDINIDANRAFARNFSNDPGNIIERSRPAGRTDATASVRQRLLDFGATSSRINAGNARVQAARSATAGYGIDVATRLATGWYSIMAQRLLQQATLEYVGRQGELRDAVERRITQGFSARGDLARIDSSIASVSTRLANIRRNLASAEAQYRALAGHDAPADIHRVPLPPVIASTREDLEALILQSPPVLKAEAEARAARQDSRAARSERLPTIAAGVDAGRYGVFENSGDYEVRGRVILRAQLGAGINARADQATARADAAEAYAARVRQETLRDAEMAWSEVHGLEDQLAAAKSAYIAGRNTRDVYAARFDTAGGTLFDLLNAEDNYFISIATYVQTLAERDLSRFILLAKTGKLLSDLSIRVDPEYGIQNDE
ncbi:adhesin transport system outer membrane protein [Sphingobium sp. OAS761]|uniref:TolC family protein n=1 Tax=Sphingobium sp. OAS761 TaxID=2817901 RepID=UPI0020A216F2|nr:TolC family protein [Sphingobium sp. OAS761]MCP1470893.1 adhesin transport system outer membrane protein [Sphingobium sp. OAS761]